MRAISLLLIAVCILCAGCTRQRTVQRTETIMGTQVTLTVVAPTAGEAEAAAAAGMAELRRLDAMMSLYKDDSEITKVNRAAGKAPVTVSPEMIEVVEAAAAVSELTKGAFDVTIGPISVLWQMKLKGGNLPTAAEISRVLPLVNYRNVVVDRKASTLFLSKSGMIMDLGGCAKGYGADRVAAIFRARGIANAVIAVAGDIWVLGRRADGKPWRIGIQHPRDKDRTLAVLELRDRYISTSGDYERFVIREKKRLHHIIDPRTGMPAEGTISVTVVGDRGALIDPLTTGLFILGQEQGLAAAARLGVEAVFVNAAGAVKTTEGLAAAVQP
jgi:thiamine biosynthesis lipoprotein